MVIELMRVWALGTKLIVVTLVPLALTVTLVPSAVAPVPFVKEAAARTSAYAALVQVYSIEAIVPELIETENFALA